MERKLFMQSFRVQLFGSKVAVEYARCWGHSQGGSVERFSPVINSDKNRVDTVRKIGFLT